MDSRKKSINLFKKDNSKLFLNKTNSTIQENNKLITSSTNPFIINTTSIFKTKTVPLTERTYNKIIPDIENTQNIQNIQNIQGNIVLNDNPFTCPKDNTELFEIYKFNKNQSNQSIKEREEKQKYRQILHNSKISDNKKSLSNIVGKYKTNSYKNFEREEVINNNIKSIRFREKKILKDRFITDSMTDLNTQEKKLFDYSLPNNDIYVTGGTKINIIPKVNYRKKLDPDFSNNIPQNQTSKLATIKRVSNHFEKEENNILHKKIIALQPRSNSVREFIEKTRELKLLQHTNKIKKDYSEKLINLNDNNLEFMNNIINEIKNVESSFSKFLTSFFDYCKSIDKTLRQYNIDLLRDREKNFSLINEISKKEILLHTINRKFLKICELRYFFIKVHFKISRLPVLDDYLTTLNKVKPCDLELIFILLFSSNKAQFNKRNSLTMTDKKLESVCKNIYNEFKEKINYDYFIKKNLMPLALISEFINKNTNQIKTENLFHSIKDLSIEISSIEDHLKELIKIRNVNERQIIELNEYIKNQTNINKNDLLNHELELNQRQSVVEKLKSENKSLKQILESITDKKLDKSKENIINEYDYYREYSNKLQENNDIDPLLKTCEANFVKNLQIYQIYSTLDSHGKIFCTYFYCRKFISSISELNNIIEIDEQHLISYLGAFLKETNFKGNINRSILTIILGIIEKAFDFLISWKENASSKQAYYEAKVKLEKLKKIDNTRIQLKLRDEKLNALKRKIYERVTKVEKIISKRAYKKLNFHYKKLDSSKEIKEEFDENKYLEDLLSYN